MLRPSESCALRLAYASSSIKTTHRPRPRLMTGPRRFEPPSSPAPDLVLATTDKQYYAVSTSYLRIHSHFFEDLFATAFTSPLHFDDFHNGLPSLTINARSATLDLVLPFVAQYAPPVAVPAMRFAALDSLIEAYPLADLWESTKAQNELRSALLGCARLSLACKQIAETRAQQSQVEYGRCFDLAQDLPLRSTLRTVRHSDSRSSRRISGSGPR